MISRHLLFPFVCLLTIIAVSCGEDDINEETRESLAQYISTNGIDAVEDESGIFYVIHEKGSDTVATEFSTVRVNYEGRLLSDDSVFDSSEDATLTLANTIEGWKVGVPLIGIGGSMTLYIPSDLAYGADGNSRIPGDANLVFDIDVLDVDGLRATAKRQEEQRSAIEDYITERGLDPIETEEGIFIHFEEEGSVDKPDSESTVTIHYYGERLDGQQIDSSYDRNKPSTFALGSVIEGWQIAIPYFGRGGSGTIIIPSELAYGAERRPGIPPHTPLAFDIELIDF